MTILSEDVRTGKKSSCEAESGEHIDMNEKLKHVKSSINCSSIKVIENIVQSVAASKNSDIGTSNNKLPLQPAAEKNLLFVHKELPGALATPDCVVTKIVEHRNAKEPEVQVLKKVRARVCNTMHRDQEFSLLNTFPEGVKERNSYFQFSVQHTQGNFTHSTSLTDTNNDVGGQVAHPQAGQSNYHMTNHMSPIGHTKLFSKEDHTIG